MSLRVWLPLNGNLNNQGASGCNPVQSTAPTYVNGKIGKAMSTGAFYLPATEVAKFYNNNAMSWCFWIYPTGSSGNAILGQQNMAAGNNRMFTIFQYPNPVDLHLSWQGEAQNNATFLSTIVTGAFTLNTQNHCAVTYNGSTALIYINGTLVASAAGTSPRTNFSYDVPLPNSSIRQLCDLRIYDHVLSPKEIKEISKGLIVHYPFDSQYETGQQNKFSGDVAAGLVGPGSFTRTKLADERGYNYKLTRTGNGGNSQPSLGTAAYSFTAGKRYYYSVKVRCNKQTVGALRLRASRSSNDQVTNSVAVCSPTLADGQQHEYYTSQVVNETYERSGTVTCSPVLEFYADNQNGNGTVYDMDFDLKDVQVVESDIYVPFIQNEYAGTTVRDTSGFGYNGTKTGTFSLVSDTAKYNSSTLFADGKNNYISSPIILGDNKNFTMNIWLKSTDGSVGTGNYHIISCIDGNKYEFSIPTTGKFRCGFVINGTRYCEDYGSINLLDKKWHMISATYDGSIIKRYVDGQLVNSQSITGTLSIGSLTIWLGRYANDNTYGDKNILKSDFRIYTTALSADDIKELYQTSASITNNGSVMCLDFQEN